jgi:hypothetical protein
MVAHRCHQRDEDLVRPISKLKPSRKNADEGTRLVIEHHLRPDDVRIATKAGLPAGVADHRYRRGVGFVFFGADRAAEDRRNTQDSKKTSGNHAPGQAKRRIDASESSGIAAVAGHSLEALRLASPVKKTGEGDGHSLIRVGHQFPGDDQTIGIGKREGLEQDSIEDAEDRAVRSHSQGDDQNRDDAEAWTLDESSRSETKVRQTAEHRRLFLRCNYLSTLGRCEPGRGEQKIPNAQALLGLRVESIALVI